MKRLKNIKLSRSTIAHIEAMLLAFIPDCDYEPKLAHTKLLQDILKTEFKAYEQWRSGFSYLFYKLETEPELLSKLVRIILRIKNDEETND